MNILTTPRTSVGTTKTWFRRRILLPRGRLYALASEIDERLVIEGDDGEEQAVVFMNSLVEHGRVKGFGKARQIPKRDYTLEVRRQRTMYICIIP